MVVWLKRALVVTALLGVVLLLRAVPTPITPSTHAQTPYCQQTDRPGQCNPSNGAPPPGCVEHDRPDQPCNSPNGGGQGNGGVPPGCVEHDRPDQPCNSPNGGGGGQGGGGGPFCDRPNGGCDPPGGGDSQFNPSQFNPQFNGQSGGSTTNSPGTFTTVNQDRITVFSVSGSGDSGAAGPSTITPQPQNMSFSDGQPVLVYFSPTAGHDLALTLTVDVVPGVSVSGAQASAGTVTVVGNQVVWRGVRLAGSDQAPVSLDLLPSGVARAIQQVTVETADAQAGQQRVTVLTPHQSGARLSAGTPRLPNTGTGGVAPRGGQNSWWGLVTDLAVALLLGVGAWSWSRLRGRPSSGA